jgi:hypothetical protein
MRQKCHKVNRLRNATSGPAGRPAARFRTTPANDVGAAVPRRGYPLPLSQPSILQLSPVWRSERAHVNAGPSGERQVAFVRSNLSTTAV